MTRAGFQLILKAENVSKTDETVTAANCSSVHIMKLLPLETSKLSSVLVSTSELDDKTTHIFIAGQDAVHNKNLESEASHVINGSSTCIRSCRKKSHPVVGLPLFSTFNEIISIDLH